jgi:hypothetical protein
MPRSKEEIEKGILSPIKTETKVRKWERKLIGALTPEAKQKALAKIKYYKEKEKQND